MCLIAFVYLWFDKVFEYREKRTYDKIEGYVLDISETRQKKLKEEDKRNPKEEPIKYFELTFQTQNENLRAVCFSPEKRKRLVQFKNWWC